MPKEEAREQGHEGAIPPPRVAAPRFTLEELPGPAFTCGPDGRKLRTNAPLRKLLDHPQEGAPSVMSLEEIFLLGADASEFLAEVRRWGRLSSTPQVLRTLQGERCPVLVTAQLIEDEQTLLATMDKVHRSPEHRLVRSPESPRDASLSASTWAHALEDLLDRFGLGVTINALDSQGNPKLVYINAAGARALGTTPGRALGGKPQPRFTDESEAVLRTERVRGPEGRHPTYVGEAEVLTEDDRSRIVEACVAYGTYMDRPSTLCLFQDVTLARRQQAQLEEAEGRHRAIVQAAGVAGVGLAVVTDPTDRATIAYVNDALAEMLGRSREELHGAPALSLVPPEEAVLFEGEDTQSLGRGGSRQLETTIVRPDGSRVEIAVGVADGRFRGEPAAFAFVRDVTEEKRVLAELRASEDRYRTLVELAPEAVLVVQDGRIRFANPVASTLTGRDLDGLMGEQLESLFGDDDHPEDLEALQTAGSGESEETKITNASGERITVDATTARISFKGRPATLLLLRDITERKLIEAAREEYTQRLAASNEDLERFAFVASHDLQEPLRMITGFLDLLERDAGDRLGEAGHEHLDQARDGAERMKEMLRALLRYSRVHASRFEPAYVDAEHAVETAIANLGAAMEEHGAVVDLEELPTVYADEPLLVQIFQNLLANAAKYGGGGADPIEVTAERIPGAWRFAVRDHGPGIPEVHQDRIFDIFHRVEPEGGQVGSGIGLAVVQRLVNRHGGQVWVESEPGEGACFYFTLPDRTDHGAQT